MYGWFQGESNTEKQEETFLYREMVKELIISWRGAWKDDFPFITIQLPNFKKRLNNPSESNWAILRESQAASLELSKTGLVCLVDAGEADDIHPKNKEIVAKRLILYQVYIIKKGCRLFLLDPMNRRFSP